MHMVIWMLAVQYDIKAFSHVAHFILITIQSNLLSSNTDGSFTMVNSNSYKSLRNSTDSSRQQIYRDFFYSYYETVCCVYSLELSR